MKLTILHTNDTHSYLDDMGKRAKKINEIREKNLSEGNTTLLIGAGDALSGDLYYNLYHGKKEAQLLNLLQYDVMTLGNHEFDGGSHILSQFIRDVNFPIVTSNINFKHDKLIAPLVEEKKILPYMIKTLSSGVKIGIFGLTTLETPSYGFPSSETIFNDPFMVAREMIDKLIELESDIIILVSHLGDDIDILLAKEIDGINVIVGGHTHVPIEENIVVNDTIIVQAGAYGEFLGEVNLEYTDTGKIKLVNKFLHKVSENAVDERLESFLSDMKQEKNKLSSHKLFTVKDRIDGERIVSSKPFSTLGNVVVDAFFLEAIEQGYQPDLAVINGGGIRSSIPNGEISRVDLIKVLPFSKQLMLLEIEGLFLFEALKYGKFPQVSKLKLYYSEKQELKRVDVSKDDKWQPLQMRKKYRVVTNSFVGQGKDNYEAFKKGIILNENIQEDVVALETYLTKLPQPINVKYEERIKVGSVI